MKVSRLGAVVLSAVCGVLAAGSVMAQNMQYFPAQPPGGSGGGGGGGGYPMQPGQPGGGYPMQPGQPGGGGGGYPGMQPGYPGMQPQQPQQPQRRQSLDELMAWERQDMGVAPTRTLHTGAMHGPTPNQIPGGQVITTKGLVALLQQNQTPVVMLDILGAQQQLPNALLAVPAAQAGSYRDNIQQGFGQMLRQATRGDMQVPLVLYCQGPECWMSYNAALRAINLGYKNVLWYRGGLEAWYRAGLPFAQANFGGGGGGQPGPYGGGGGGGGQNPYAGGGGQNPYGGGMPQNPYAQPGQGGFQPRQ